MHVFIAEYAVANGNPDLIEEGSAMLNTLVTSFQRCGHTTHYPTMNTRLPSGKPLFTDESFTEALTHANRCDAGIVIAPDDLLYEATEVLEDHTCNLGSPPDAVRISADKLSCTKILKQHKIPAPQTMIDEVPTGKWVIKPRYGCGGEDVRVVDLKSTEKIPPGFVATEYIQGEHISVSLIKGETTLPLTINRQIIRQNDNTITYHGNQTPWEVKNREEVLKIATETVRAIGCRGYTGVDIVNGDQPYVIDVNPRPTTSIVPISQILTCEIAELILNAKTGLLPEKITTLGNAEIELNSTTSL
ncbi:hypothetical protein B6V01_000565 [Methanosarcinales archaeon ex4572_44]|nr:MAG: hypothetical protein B6V01_000565 [Methanosarcinales archaeon ex4572_44]RLG26418.1 MAG: hypothetical protein DRN85_03055 [Methanosarcinales archaeon]